MDEPSRPVPTEARYSIARAAGHRAARCRALAAAALRCWALAVVFAHGPAHAHESPAEPPLFFAGDCIDVVDPAELDALEIPYAVAFDDTELTQGDIPVADAKTHQFFAFRGTLIARGFDYEFYGFEPDAAEPAMLPLWINVDDVKRAAQANGAGSGTTFAESDVPDDAVLDQHPALQDRFLRITGDDERVPITEAQAQRGVRWQLGSVPPGLYTIAGYIFSPPYNGWAVRPGLVAVAASDQPVTAAVIESIHEVVFASEGRRVRACLRAPAGSTLQALFKIQERPELGWLPWLPPRPIDAESLELCFRNSRPELGGSARLRFELTTADGAVAVFYSPDTLTMLPGGAECTPSDTICCDGSPPGPAACADGGADGCDAGSGAGPDEPPDAAQPPAATDAAAHDAGSGGAGCTAARATPAARGRDVSLLLLVPLALQRRRRRLR